jgi:hypothetical protein
MLTRSSSSVSACSLRIAINYLTHEISNSFQTCFHLFDRPAVDRNWAYVLYSVVLLYIQILKMLLINGRILSLNLQATYQDYVLYKPSYKYMYTRT